MPDSDGETSFAFLCPLTRLNAETLKPQLDMAGQLNFLKFPYHQAIIKSEIPLSIGGGIGQSRTLLLICAKPIWAKLPSAYGQRL
jgi:asparagine synthetase A